MSRLTPRNVDVARQIIARYPIGRSALIPLLHLAQAQDGHLTSEAMEHAGELVGLTAAEVLSTASFYEMFKREPVGRYLVGVCTNVVCLLRGAGDLLDHAQERLGTRPGGTTDDAVFTLEEAQCLAACGGAPCVQVNYRYFEHVSPADLDVLFDDLRARRYEDDIPPHGVLNHATLSAPVTDPTPVESLALRERH
jgi:NADH-quinone oxidoreductase subunit E